MRITVIGWYGTETIGDRAIFAGLVSLFSEVFGDLDIRLGCLGIVLSERTLDEDIEFLKKCSEGYKLNVELFDSRIKRELDQFINWADIVCMGGGPLMELEELAIPLYAFSKAKKKGKYTLLAGCGMGPFITKKKIKTALKIARASDFKIFRDEKSLSIYNSYVRDENDAVAAIDPAIFAVKHFQAINETKPKNYIAANFREPTSEYGVNVNRQFFCDYMEEILNKNKEDVILVPMHTFEFGGDDRYILNAIKRIVANDRIHVENKPTSLTQTMELYANATGCIGMRFHAILLQTLLNGKNMILDYTDPIKGKTINLIKQFNIAEQVENRYYSLINNTGCLRTNIIEMPTLKIEDSIINKYRSVYINQLKQIH
ncbi:polysaccharide pyruvyl transferase family protein [Alloprevotella sp. OH1205_COT-284]|uniref:polysaccharide pyruvyl transferase family protein n=1 Tax=Alloprevotella sp. OH1205_COT-284 TaxID=2491043 RepID=UPI000F603939|nr:polysaccharide pyruvyl transferase family protein [Alloprevotella sp. OH1205_COT-284]RRD80595.1 polysaccharide pyruvyl transferase family protein [Alloprevotella sp. OH1205_COT-284]